MAENTDKAISRTDSTSNDVPHCMVCCEEINIFSIGSCDHPICYKCSTRMRVLSNQKYCPSCRCELDQVVFSHECKKFSAFQLNNMLGNRKHGIRFGDGSIRKDFDTLQDYACTMCSDGPFGSMSLLKSHIRKEHDKQFCLICLKNLTVFPCEIKTYSKKEMVRHRKEGDSDEKSHRGHPECRFCDERFFDNDALLLHLRKSHFWCHFCEHDGKQDYYDVYESLRQHFAEYHFLCDEGACINEKFTSVYRDEIDFKAHKLAMHRKKLSKFQAKEARKVDIDFTFEQRGASSNNNGIEYHDIRPEFRRRQGNNNNASNSSHSNKKPSTTTNQNTSHRYHREANGTLNFYDYEDVEKDRRKFLGKPHRHEAEEVDQGRGKINHRRMAATRSLSQSEPDIPLQLDSRDDYDDDVIGFSECISGDIPKRKPAEPVAKPVKVKQEKPVKPTKQEMPPRPASPPHEPAPVPVKQQPPPPPPEAPNASVENFPTLPGSRPYIPVHIKKKTEDFPALPMAAAVPVSKSAKGNWNGSAATKGGNVQKKEITHINGLVVKTVKNKKKGKQKQQQAQPANDSDFPVLGRTEKKADTPKPPPTAFKKPDPPKPPTPSKKADTPKPPPSRFNKFEPPAKNNPPPTKNNSPPLMEKKNGMEPRGATAAVSKEALSTKRPPPGFKSGSLNGTEQKPPVSSGPPGFSKITSQNTRNDPPPGLKSQPLDNNNSAERNMNLVEMLCKFLSESNLNVFRDLSGQFRRGAISGQNYYDGISELLGDNLKYLFSELVSLLPDEDKQNELLRVRNNAKIKSKQREQEMKADRAARATANQSADYSKPAQWGSQRTQEETAVAIAESRCEKCGVMVLNSEIQEHLASHGELFPALPTTTKKKKNYSFVPMTRQSKHVSSAWQK